jgi:hypothetical protein
MYDGILEGQVHHQAPGESLLGIAARVAGKQARGDAWVWTSVKEGTDVSPLKAVTIAAHVLNRPKAEPRKKPGMVVGYR